MCIRSKLIVFVPVLSTLLLFGFSINQKPQWKGKIEEENGVKVIKNPNEPLYGEITFELEEDLSIGNEEDENCAFYSSVVPAVDSEGNIFILDGGNFRIQKFDRAGNYIQTIGREGEGPGEFERPMSLYLDGNDKIYVTDGGRIHVFRKDGEFLDTITFKLFGRSVSAYFRITNDGNIIGVTTTRGRRKSDKPMDYELFNNIDIFDMDGKLVNTIATYRWETGSPLQYGRGMTFPNNLHTSQLYFCQLNEELNVYGNGSEYVLIITNSLGEIVFRIEKDEIPRPLTKKDKDKVINHFMEGRKKRKRQEFSRSEVKKAMGFPNNKPFFDRILSDGKEFIYVKKFKSALDEDRNSFYDLFNKEGYYLYHLKLPFPKGWFIIKRGYIYTSEYEEESGYARIKRYKIKNWDRIKEAID